jgi:hypothetical protein
MHKAGVKYRKEKYHTMLNYGGIKGLLQVFLFSSLGETKQWRLSSSRLIPGE